MLPVSVCLTLSFGVGRSDLRDYWVTSRGACVSMGDELVCGPSKTMFLQNVNHIGPKLSVAPNLFFYRRRTLMRSAELVDDNKQIHS